MRQDLWWESKGSVCFDVWIIFLLSPDSFKLSLQWVSQVITGQQSPLIIHSTGESNITSAMLFGAYMNEKAQ